MAQEQGGQVISRAIRDNLGTFSRAADELNHAVADLVAACSSTNPANALPPMLRAQTAAASLAASLDVLSRFLMLSLQPAMQVIATETVVTRAVAEPAPSSIPAVPPPSVPAPMGMRRDTIAMPMSEVPMAEPAAPPMEAAPPPPPPPVMEAEMVPPPPPVVEAPPSPQAAAPAAAFDVKSLPLDEQELHRRANRVAKVTMQDIKMLKPDAVRQGRENKDLCKRLKDDMDKGRKEYERRFKAIFHHPVDYFFDWAVEILADGDPSALGDYPYPSPKLQK